MQDKNIFITGAAGKIGRFLTGELINRGCTVTALCMEKEEKPKVSQIMIVTGDLLKPESYSRALEGIDTVLHMAAVTHTNNVNKYYEINSNATLSLIEACKARGVKRFIFISTRAISAEGGHYSKSKSIAEAHVRESGLDWVILRLGEVYGISSRTGVDMVLRSIESSPVVPVFGNGEYRLAPVHISDVISCIAAAIERPDSKNKIYNIAGPEGFSYNQFIDRISKLKQKKSLKVYIPVFAFKILAKVSALILRDAPIVEDQLPRLLCQKNEDISLTTRDLDFRPAPIEKAIKAA